MSDTPRTDKVLASEYEHGAIRDGAGDVIDGVTAEEAFNNMVSGLQHLCPQLERENARLREALEQLQAILCDPEGEPCFIGSDGDHNVARNAFQALRDTGAK